MSAVKSIQKIIKEHKRIVYSTLFLLLFSALLVVALIRGVKDPVKPSEIGETKPPKVLETAFDRWYRGENGELLASFYLINHTDAHIAKIMISCAAYTVNDIQTNSYTQVINVTLLPGEVRHLDKTFIGELDPLAVKAICRVDSWE
jgi:hypothetical protein